MWWLASVHGENLARALRRRELARLRGAALRADFYVMAEAMTRKAKTKAKTGGSRDETARYAVTSGNGKLRGDGKLRGVARRRDESGLHNLRVGRER